MDKEMGRGGDDVTLTSLEAGLEERRARGGKWVERHGGEEEFVDV
jgi:hypothetical protein